MPFAILRRIVGATYSEFEFHWTRFGKVGEERASKDRSTRPSFFGLEKHLLDLYKNISDFKPQAVVIDPLTSLIGEGSQQEIQSMVTRMIDLLKSEGITGFFTSLVSSTAQNFTGGEVGVSSLIDTWIVVREIEEDAGKKRMRGLYIVKSRGMGHSSDVHKLILSDAGVEVAAIDSPKTDSKQRKKVDRKVLQRKKDAT